MDHCFDSHSMKDTYTHQCPHEKYKYNLVITEVLEFNVSRSRTGTKNYNFNYIFYTWNYLENLCLRAQKNVGTLKAEVKKRFAPNYFYYCLPTKTKIKSCASKHWAHRVRFDKSYGHILNITFLF